VSALKIPAADGAGFPAAGLCPGGPAGTGRTFLLARLVGRVKRWSSLSCLYAS
jgi:hypothetical protein